MRQIINLYGSTQDPLDAELIGGGAVFWLLASPNYIKPLPTFKSALPVATSYSAWAASTVHAVGDVVIPTAPNGLAYTCTTAGTSGTVQPTWTTTILGTFSDNTVVWTANAVDNNSGVTPAELALLQSGLVVEVIWNPQESATTLAMQTTIQNAYATEQSNLLGAAATGTSFRLANATFNGTTWTWSLAK